MVTYRVHRLPGEVVLEMQFGPDLLRVELTPEEVITFVGDLIDALRPVPECPSLAALIEGLG